MKQLYLHYMLLWNGNNLFTRQLLSFDGVFSVYFWKDNGECFSLNNFFFKLLLLFLIHGSGNTVYSRKYKCLFLQLIAIFLYGILEYISVLYADTQMMNQFSKNYISQNYNNSNGNVQFSF